MIFVILFAIFFMIFMVFFPLFWVLAFCGCWFLPLTKFSKVLISVLILAMLCGGIAFLFFDNKDSVYPFLFACGFISLPVFLYYFWRRQESYEKYYHIIHTNTLAKNNLKRRAISLFSIGLLGTFMSLWQVEVPQKIILDITHKYSNLNIKIIDNNYKIIIINDQGKIKDNVAFYESKEFILCKRETIGCPFIFSFSYPLYDIYIYDNIDFTGNKKIIAKTYASAYNHTFLSGFGSISSVGKGIAAYGIYNQEDEIINFLKENQIKQGENKEF